MLLKRILKVLLGLLLAILALAAVVIGLGAYFLYTPEPEPPALSGTIAKGSLEFGGLTRTYQSYLPKDLPKGAPLVVVMHGAGESSADIRVETGYAFERLADKERFALVYPNGFQGYWNSCSAVDDNEATHRDIDDVGFLAALEDKLVAEAGIDPARIFATGVSNGGEMAIRLALEAPSRYRAVAPVAANVEATENFRCKPAAGNPVSVLLIHGTGDRLEPYEGGEGSLFGFFSSGKLLSARDSGQYFADFDKIGTAPATTHGKTADGFATDIHDWRAETGPEVELFAIRGAGHVFPQPYYTARRLLGASPKDPDGAVLIWDFFRRQATSWSQQRRE